MSALNQDSRLVMAILFVGSMSGINVFFYSNYGAELPWSALSHAILFGLVTVGAIMIMKVIFDLALNDRIEIWLMDRRILTFWERQRRDEEQRQKFQQSSTDFMKQYNVTNLPTSYEAQEVSNTFLASIEQ
tara:strand:- start:2096 stop:2488 length:393 start_codon:yes stop_codon:yes gene_type:complete